VSGSPDVFLRPVQDDDLPIFYEHQSDTEAAAMAAFGTRPLIDFMAHWATIRATPSAIALTIVVDGIAAGHVNAWMEGDHREIGYWLGRSWWGRGIGTRAVGLLIADLPERPLIAHVADHNVGSRRVLEKNGFVRIGGAVVDGMAESTYRLD
jgi:RimJ/RimL family protein N-acetyltransferase